MTIRKGQEWGVEVDRPGDLVVLAGDAALADAVAAGERRPLAVAAGDLHRTLGAPPTDRPRPRRVPIDALRVELDDRTLLAVAHVVARPPGPLGWWRGQLVAAMNTDHLRDWAVAPRNHPGDGRVEVLDVAATMSWRQRWAARRRLPAGTFLPHPDIATSSVPSVEWRFARPMRVEADGRSVGSTRHLRVTVEPDAFELHV
jgi:hypothetical protein